MSHIFLRNQIDTRIDRSRQLHTKGCLPIMGAKVFDAEDVSIQLDQDDKSFFNFEGYGYIGLQFAKLTNVMKVSIADDGFLVSA